MKLAELRENTLSISETWAFRRVTGPELLFPPPSDDPAPEPPSPAPLDAPLT